MRASSSASDRAASTDPSTDPSEPTRTSTSNGTAWAKTFAIRSASGRASSWAAMPTVRAGDDEVGVRRSGRIRFASDAATRIADVHPAERGALEIQNSAASTGTGYRAGRAHAATAPGRGWTVNLVSAPGQLREPRLQPLHEPARFGRRGVARANPAARSRIAWRPAGSRSSDIDRRRGGVGRRPAPDRDDEPGLRQLARSHRRRRPRPAGRPPSRRARPSGSPRPGTGRTRTSAERERSR